MSKQWPQGAEEGEVVRDDDIFGLYKPSDTPAVADGSLNKKKSAPDVKAYMKGTTKVLWTGPLSVVSTPTSLDGAEKFSDWDMIEVDLILHSDVSNAGYTPLTTSDLVNVTTLRLYSDSGYLQFRRLSDTTFQLDGKTVAAGNISKIIGISL